MRQAPLACYRDSPVYALRKLSVVLCRSAGRATTAAHKSGYGPKAKSAERVATSAFGGQSGLVLLVVSSSG